ncbi:MAG: penicillin-binding protein 1A [Pseudomonadaceae bacterium]|nr:penicillin-binding protein 1A [Pseudomonadaceae bacterium]
MPPIKKKPSAAQSPKLKRGAAVPSSSRKPKQGRGWMKRLVILAVWLGVFGVLVGAISATAVVMYYSSQLPDFRKLTDYQPSLITKVYDRNGAVIAEFAKERRIWMPVGEMPKLLINAYLAAEDTDFYHHGGYDLKAIIRAALSNLLTNRKQGASTITQQVAKTFLLSSERTYDRKVKELLLSWRIEQVYSKDEILEMYLNRIYLGNGSYGVAAAAQTYFSKTLPELNVAEAALLAGLPQAPSRYNPLRNPDKAKARRDLVLSRMEKERMITPDQAAAAREAGLGLNPSPLKRGDDAPHFSEYIRRMVEQQYGSKALYEDGLIIYTTLDLETQKEAETAVYEGLRDYDRRHGWRGPLMHFDSMADWPQQLEKVADSYSYSTRIGEPAVVVSVGDKVMAGLYDERKVEIAPASAKWTGRSLAKLVKTGDVVMLKRDGKGAYNLEQIPEVQGGLAAVEVRSGEVLAMVGGLGEGVGFNRAIQAKRQVGSAFKPFVYTAALENGFTPASIVMDAPVVFRHGDSSWKPQNYDGKMSGPTPLRIGLEKSKNLMTINLAQEVGLRAVSDVVRRMGIPDRVPTTDLTVALGTVDMSLLDMTAAYAVYPRGGLFVPPSFISRIQDNRGKTLYRGHPACEGCLQQFGGSPDKVPAPPPIPATQALSPQVAYQMTSMLEGVVKRGTGYSASKLGLPLGGKTGTTNDYVDAWFMGFSPEMAVGVWVGFDKPRSLGHNETGARAALPIWKDFVAASHKGRRMMDFPVPEGIEFVQVDADNGMLPGPTTERVITEPFVPGTAPTTTAQPSFWDGIFGGESGAEDGNGGGFNPFGIF